MNCLTDYIGLRGCGSSAPASGFYINDLPGISLKQMVSLTNEEEKTYLDLWAMIQTRAQSRFSLDVREAMGKHYKLKSLMQGVNLGNVTGANVNWPAPLNIQGFAIELIESNTYDYVPSPLASIHVQDLRFYANSGALAQQFAIYDLSNGSQLFTYTTDVVAGWNVIPVNQTLHNNYAVNSWRIGCFFVDQGDIANAVTMDLPLGHTIPGCCDVRIRGVYAEGVPVPADTVFTTNTYGLSGTFSIVCSWDAVVCQNKVLFTRPWWYLLGIELLTEQLYSSKLNQFTTVNLQRAKELREEYQVEYMKALEQIAGGFNLACDCCIECSGGVQLRETTSFY